MTVYVYCYRAQEKVDKKTSRAFFEHALRRHFGGRAELPLRGEEENGKPCFPLEPEEQFSVSHTGPFFAVAFCRGARIGLDLEQVNPNVRPLRVARRFFSLQETGALERAKDPAKEFARLWTKKEAAVKLTGEGLSALGKGREREFFLRDLSKETSQHLGESLFCTLACEKKFTVRMIGGKDL